MTTRNAKRKGMTMKTELFTETQTLGAIIDMTPPNSDGWPVLDALGLEYDKLTPADLNRLVRCTWPEHCTFHRFNGDATYELL